MNYVLDPTEIAAAKTASHRRHLEIVANRLRRCNTDSLRRLLLDYERQRLVDEARLVRQEWARRCPAMAEALAREAIEYERRRMIDAEDARDYMMFHRALKRDLAGRDLDGVAHECAMYERLGWQDTAQACRRELERRQEEAQRKDLSAYLDGGADEQREKTACTRE